MCARAFSKPRPRARAWARARAPVRIEARSDQASASKQSPHTDRSDAHQGITVSLMMTSLYAQKRQRELGWYPEQKTPAA